MTHMSPAEAIYFAALQKGTARERAAYLAETCAGDETLRRRVERLLAASPHVGDFMEQPAVLALMADTLRGAGTPAEWQPCPPPDWATVLPPRYQVREEIGRGGM